MIKGFKCCVCPYCGSAPSVIPLYDNRNLLVYEGQAVQSRQYGYRLECPSCGFHAPVSFGAVINKAVSLWNTSCLSVRRLNWGKSACMGYCEVECDV